MNRPRLLVGSFSPPHLAHAISISRSLFFSASLAADYETDALIQRTLRTELHDCTLITIAHQLLSIIDYDVVLVLSDGKVVS